MSSWDGEIERTEINGYTLVLAYQQDASDPREDDQLGVMACEHRNYTLGDQTADEAALLFTAIDEYRKRPTFALIERYCRIAFGSTVVLPLYLLDHSGLSMSAGGPSGFDPGGWDTSQVGFIFDTARTREECGTPLERIEECLRGEVATYSQYLQGEVYVFIVEDKRGDIYSSCGGFYSFEEAKAAGTNEVPTEPDTKLTDTEALDAIRDHLSGTFANPSRLSFSTIESLVTRTGRKVTP